MFCSPPLLLSLSKNTEVAYVFLRPLPHPVSRQHASDHVCSFIPTTPTLRLIGSNAGHVIVLPRACLLTPFECSSYYRRFMAERKSTAPKDNVWGAPASGVVPCGPRFWPEFNRERARKLPIWAVLSLFTEIDMCLRHPCERWYKRCAQASAW